MGFWKALIDNVFKDYTKPEEISEKDSSFTIDIIPEKNKSSVEGRHFSEIIKDANAGKELRPGESTKILRLMMPDNPVDQLFEKVINKKGESFLPEIDPAVAQQLMFVIDFKQDVQPKKWEGDVQLFTSQKRLDLGKNYAPNTSLNFPTTQTTFQDFIRDLASGAIVTVNPMTPAVGCYEWEEGKFSYRGMPK